MTDPIDLTPLVTVRGGLDPLAHPRQFLIGDVGRGRVRALDVDDMEDER